MQVKYMLMKLSTTMVMMGRETKVQGCAGYIPVFNTEAEASQNNPEGKFKIIPIEFK